MAHAAYALLRDEMPLRRTAELLASVAEERARLPVPPSAPRPCARARRPRRRCRARQRFPSLIEDEETGKLRAALKDVRLQLLDQRRTLERLPPARPPVVARAESPAYATADAGRSR